MPQVQKFLSRHANVITLNSAHTIPHPKRILAMRQWHLAQAAAADQVAALHISFTTNGALRTSGVGLEPEHVEALLQHLGGIEGHLLSSRDQCYPPPPAFLAK